MKLRDFSVYLGFVAIIFGVGLWSVPAGFVIGGVLIVSRAIIGGTVR